MSDNVDISIVRSAIENSAWFSGLPNSVLNELAAACKTKRFNKDDFIWSVGQPTAHLFNVLSGRTMLSMSGSMGQEFSLNEFDAGSWLGEASLAGDEPRIADLVAIDDCLILMLPRATFFKVAKEYPVLYKNLFHSTIDRTRLLYGLLGGMIFYSLRARLAGRMLDLALNYGEQVGGEIFIKASINQVELSRLCMGSRQRVNKIFGDWSRRNICSVKFGQYVISDVDALKAEIESGSSDI